MPLEVGLGDGDGVEVGSELVELTCVPARFKWQHNSATQAGLKASIDGSLNKICKMNLTVE